MNGDRAGRFIAAGLGILAVLVPTVSIASSQWLRHELSDPFVRTGVTAVLVLLIVFLVPALVRPFDVSMRRVAPWVIGLVAVLPALIGFLVRSRVDDLYGIWVFGGMRVPLYEGVPYFWDATLILQSIDCSRVGVDVYAFNNGCLPDPALYGPGQLWLKYVPFDIFSAGNAPVLGVIGILLSGLAAVWLARQSSGRGQIALFAAVLGGSWILLLERGNVDMVLIWAAILVVVLVRRWPHLWSWYLAAAIVWLMGTWKYYPFAMGVMLLPALRLRHGWTVVAGYAAAVIAWFAANWTTFEVTRSISATMPNLSDLVVLGRTGLVARMVGSDSVVTGVTWADGVLALLVLVALAWGLWWGWTAPRSWVTSPGAAMLAAAGGVLVLSTVFVVGFGYAYKAAFLLLCIPLVGRGLARAGSVRWYASSVNLILIAVAVIAVWNTTMATVAGLVASAFATGSGGALLLRSAVLRSSARLDRSPA